MRRIALVSLLVIAAAALAAPAVARDRHGHGGDRVVLTLTEEGWVETETARLLVSVDSAISADEAAAVRSRIKATLGELVANVDWRVTRFDRSRDAAGLERWHLEAEARVPEAGLDGIHDRAKGLSRPGEQVRVVGVDFTPTLAEREAVLAELRSAIYARAKDELGRFNRVYPDRAFRIRRIDFTGRAYRDEGRDYAETGGMRAAVSPMMAAPGGPASVSERVVVEAVVVLGAERPRRPKDGRRDD